MTRIKICGITNVEDARAAIEWGADALGFILVPESPRFIGDDDDLAADVAHFSPFTMRVAVCRNATDLSGEFASLVDAVQFYDPDWYRPELQKLPPLRYISAVSLKERSSLTEVVKQWNRVSPDAMLIDAHHPDRLGGTGVTADWTLAREARDRLPMPVVLAGGLTAENVADAIAAVRPYAVDVSSGVEAEPGRKDHAKLKAFIRAVRRIDEELR